MLQLSFVWWVSDLLLVHGCYSGSYFVSAAYIVEKGKSKSQITNRLFMGLYVLHLVVQHNVYDLLFRCCSFAYIFRGLAYTLWKKEKHVG